MKVCVVGITGLVGSELLKVLNESLLKIDVFIPAASEKSAGKKVVLRGSEYNVVTPAQACEMKPDIAIFSAGSAVSKEWAPRFAENGCYVIDNSSQWRMEKEIPLIVPEINAATIQQNDHIISNPNCSTIQMVLALSRLHENFCIRRIVVSTYQSVSGTGIKAVRQLMDERVGKAAKKEYPHPIDLNCLPHGGNFLENGYTSEEEKLVFETRKILGSEEIQVSATVVRVPVIGGHSESVNVEFERPFEMEDIVDLLKETTGIVVQDDPESNLYPMPIYAQGKDEVFVGRIRRDDSIENGLNMWIVADNLRKGAATNAVQIAEYLEEVYF
jgi:aspartate-semialdehyde dehydrogenase